MMIDKKSKIKNHDFHPRHCCRRNRLGQIAILIIGVFIYIFLLSCTVTAESIEQTTIDDVNQATDDPIEQILIKIKQNTKDLKSYQAKLWYLFVQHPLLESQTLQTGDIYYRKINDKSKLRINFETIKQDDEKEQDIKEYLVFDGVWLTHIDYQLQHCQKRQLVEPNEAVDAFDLVTKNIPIIGFTKIEDLKKHFDIQLIDENIAELEGFKSNDITKKGFIHFRLITKKESEYSKDYTSIDFWIYKSSYLPAQIIAKSTEQETYQIRLLNPIINKEIDEKTFDIKIPGSFGEPDIIPLKKNN